MLKRLLIILTLLLLVAALLVLIFRWEHKDDPNHLTLFGNVDVRQVDISFRVQGLVRQMPFQEGDLVEKGALLAELDDSPYTDQVREAESNLESIRIQFENANRLFQRRRDLIEGGGVSREDLESSEANYHQLVASYQSAEAALSVAQANLSYTKAYAPNEGIILTRVREPGSVVNPTDPVYTVSLSNPIWIRTYVSEPQLGLIHPGMDAEIFTDTPNSKVYHGRIGFISPVAEFTPKSVETTQLRTDLVYRLRIYVEDSEGLRQGQPVTIKLRIKQSDEDPRE